MKLSFKEGLTNLKVNFPTRSARCRCLYLARRLFCQQEVRSPGAAAGALGLALADQKAPGFLHWLEISSVIANDGLLAAGLDGGRVALADHK